MPSSLEIFSTSPEQLTVSVYEELAGQAPDHAITVKVLMPDEGMHCGPET